MIKKIALAAIAASVLAGPAFASGKMETPDMKDLLATSAIAKTPLQHVTHKVSYRKNMEQTSISPLAS
ncbi:MAG: hypothetical protein WA138_02650 [Parvibaculum sp.]